MTQEESLDPVLTRKGVDQAMAVEIDSTPDLILISPMTRTLLTANFIFGKEIHTHASEVQVWPELRECYDHLICKGSPKHRLQELFPWLDFRRCHDEWDYESHSTEGAMIRAENVRMRLKALSQTYKHIVVVTHRAFAAFLVQGPAFGTCGEFLNLLKYLYSWADDI